MKTLYRNFKLLDGTPDMKVQEGLYLLVENGKIVDLGNKIGDVTTISRAVDLGGRYLMPGLINLHVHLPASGKAQNKPKDNRGLVKFVLSNGLTKKIGLLLGKKGAKVELYSGVTTLRAVGGVGDLDTVLRDKINTGSAIGPRILAANTAIATEGGHMVGTVAAPVKTPEEASAMVEKLVGERVDFIKLMITGGVLDAVKRGEPGILKMPPEIIRAACYTAHQNGLKVAAHVESPEGVRVALENGVDTIEHGAVLGEAEVALFHGTKAAFICTISPALPFARFDPSLTGATEMAQYNGEIVLNGEIEGSKRALEEGIPVGLGTDTGCPYITHYDMWRELVYFQKWIGASPEFTLYSATLGNAKIAGVDRETGSIAIGKSADFIVTDRNPLESFTALKELYMVVCRGKQYDKPKVKKYAACEKALDEHLPV